MKIWVITLNTPNGTEVFTVKKKTRPTIEEALNVVEDEGFEDYGSGDVDIRGPHDTELTIDLDDDTIFCVSLDNMRTYDFEHDGIKNNAQAMEQARIDFIRILERGEATWNIEVE